jgi:hypothetical protein
MQSAWAYLNVESPLVAWLVYRGEMFSADMAHLPPEAAWTPLSIFHTGRLRSIATSVGTYENERAIDEVRRRDYPEKISRLSGFYVFGDEDSAQRAEGLWDGNFRQEFLCEVGLRPGSKVTRYDSNWITHEFRGGPGTWVARYVAGEPYDRAPLWEYVVEGTAVVYGTALRERAYATVAQTWPESLALLELGRIAAELGSSLGRVVALPIVADQNIRIRYILDMIDAEEPGFLSRIKAFVDDASNPVNHADLTPISEEDWFRVPDLTEQEFTVAGP